MAWRPKSRFEKYVEDFYEECRTDSHLDFITLRRERVFAEVWVDVLNHLDVYPQQQIDEFETLIKVGIEDLWGPCKIEFNRQTKKIYIMALDGKAMELISGEKIGESDAR